MDSQCSATSLLLRCDSEADRWTEKKKAAEADKLITALESSHVRVKCCKVHNWKSIFASLTLAIMSSSSVPGSIADVQTYWWLAMLFRAVQIAPLSAALPPVEYKTFCESLNRIMFNLCIQCMFVSISSSIYSIMNSAAWNGNCLPRLSLARKTLHPARASVRSRDICIFN